MKRISTHILDTARGRAGERRARASGAAGELRASGGCWRRRAPIDDGRCSQLLPEGETLAPGIYRLAFDTAGYFAAQEIEGLYPIVQITFAVRDGETHFHIPLLLSPHGYTTYRGS